MKQSRTPSKEQQTDKHLERTRKTVNLQKRDLLKTTKKLNKLSEQVEHNARSVPRLVLTSAQELDKKYNELFKTLTNYVQEQSRTIAEVEFLLDREHRYTKALVKSLKVNDATYNDITSQVKGKEVEDTIQEELKQKTIKIIKKVKKNSIVLVKLDNQTKVEESYYRKVEQVDKLVPEWKEALTGRVKGDKFNLKYDRANLTIEVINVYEYAENEVKINKINKVK